MVDDTPQLFLGDVPACMEKVPKCLMVPKGQSGDGFVDIPHTRIVSSQPLEIFRIRLDQCLHLRAADRDAEKVLAVVGRLFFLFTRSLDTPGPGRLLHSGLPQGVDAFNGPLGKHQKFVSAQFCE